MTTILSKRRTSVLRDRESRRITITPELELLDRTDGLIDVTVITKELNSGQRIIIVEK